MTPMVHSRQSSLLCLRAVFQFILVICIYRQIDSFGQGRGFSQLHKSRSQHLPCSNNIVYFSSRYLRTNENSNRDGSTSSISAMNNFVSINSRHRRITRLLASTSSLPEVPEVDEGDMLDALGDLQTLLTSDDVVPKELSNIEDTVIPSIATPPVIPVSNKPQVGLKEGEKPTIQPPGTSYIMCSACKTAYVVPPNGLGSKGARVRCTVCEKEWFQSLERVAVTDEYQTVFNMTSAKVGAIRQSIESRGWPKFPLTDRFGVFIGNLPYTYTEKDIGDLFGEYGITGISLVKDAEGASKGFAFLEVANDADVEVIVREMHHFYIGPRKLTVRLAQPPTSRVSQGGGGGGGGGRTQGGGGGGGGVSKSGTGGGKVWTPRGKSGDGQNWGGLPAGAAAGKK